MYTVPHKIFWSLHIFVLDTSFLIVVIFQYYHFAIIYLLPLLFFVRNGLLHINNLNCQNKVVYRIAPQQLKEEKKKKKKNRENILIYECQQSKERWGGKKKKQSLLCSTQYQFLIMFSSNPPRRHVIGYLTQFDPFFKLRMWNNVLSKPSEETDPC